MFKVSVLLLAGLVSSVPVRRQAKLDQAATAQAQQFDATATRAFTATEIKTSDGKCWTIDPLGGDFRENLIPITTAACTGAKEQQWDVLTAGKHNNRAGFANVVSTLTNGCLNFDPRRAAGNQVLLFSCGGRADGEGQVTDSQLFPFTGGAGPLTLSPANTQGATCLVAKNGAIDQAACDKSAGQQFTFGAGGAASGGNGAAASSPAAASSSAATSTSASAAPASTSAAAPAAGSKTTLPITKLDQAATKAANTRDDTATRAFSGTTVKTANGKCLQATSGTGDFRNNLVPIQVVPCDGSAGQKWDVITKGKHNNANGAALIVNTAIQGCMNLDLRRQPGNQVNLFSCGGRADGEGAVTDSQLWKFNGQAKNAIQSASTGSNANKCMVEKNGLLDVAACTGAAAQTFTFGNGAAAGGATGGAAGGASSNTSTKAAASTTAATSSSAAAASTSAAAPATSAVTTLPITKLDQAATAAANQRDGTATRAFSGAAVKTADGKCLQAVSGTGDFRNNLVPITVETCNGSAEQKWDVITKGKHNNVNGAALIVNTAIQGCMNLDLRRQPGNQALLFSCGGRADGEGAVTDSQLWKFDGQATNPIESASTGGNAGKCLVNNNGRLDVVACNGAAAQDFTFA